MRLEMGHAALQSLTYLDLHPVRLSARGPPLAFVEVPEPSQNLGDAAFLTAEKGDSDRLDGFGVRSRSKRRESLSLELVKSFDQGHLLIHSG